jgi:hypothetical protein
MPRKPGPGQKDDILEGAPELCARRRLFSLRKQPHRPRRTSGINYLVERYPDKAIIDNVPDSLPKNMTLEQYVVAVVQIDIGETSQERVTSAVQGLLTHAYLDLAIGQDDRAAGFLLLAEKVHANYQAKMGRDQPRASLPPLNDLRRVVLNLLLDSQRGLPFAARAALRTQLGMPAETTAPPQTVSTNAVAPTVSPVVRTNSPATNSVAR